MRSIKLFVGKGEDKMDFDESMSSDELQDIAFQCELKKDYVKAFAYMEKALTRVTF